MENMQIAIEKKNNDRDVKQMEEKKKNLFIQNRC